MGIKVEVGQVWLLTDESLDEELQPILTIIDVNDGRTRSGEVLTVFSSLEEEGCVRYSYTLNDHYTLAEIKYTEDQITHVKEEIIMNSKSSITKEDLILFRHNLQNIPAVIAFKVGDYNLQYLAQIIDDPDEFSDLKYLDDKYWSVLHQHMQPLLFDLCFYHTKNCVVLDVLTSKTFRNIVNMKDREFDKLLAKCKDDGTSVDDLHRHNVNQLIG